MIGYHQRTIILFLISVVESACQNPLYCEGEPNNHCRFDAAIAPDSCGPECPKVEFLFAGSVGDEGNMPDGTKLNIQFRLEPAPSQDVIVKFAVTEGDSVTSSDFEIPGGARSVMIRHGEGMGVIQVNIKHDDENEDNNETITLMLERAEGVELGEQNTHTITISDDLLPRLQFVANTSSADESTTPSIMLMVEGGASGPVEATLALLPGGTATPDIDHRLAPEPLMIPAMMTGMMIPVTMVTIMDDQSDEINERFAIAVSTTAGAVVGSTNVHTYTIIDDDDRPTVGFVSTIPGSEAEEGIVNIDVELSTASGKQVTVDFAVMGGTAMGGGVDYTLADGTLPFQLDTKKAQIQIAITPDIVSEFNETISVNLTNPTNASPGTVLSYSMEIVDDEGLARVQFDSRLGNKTFSERNSNTNIFCYPVVRSGTRKDRVIVNVSLMDSEATIGEDFDISPSDTVVTFQQGELKRDICITVKGDTDREPNETIRMTLVSAVNAMLEPDRVRTHTINNDD